MVELYRQGKTDWRLTLMSNTYKIAVRTSERTQAFSVTNTGHVMLFKEMGMSGQLHAPFSLTSVPAE